MNMKYEVKDIMRLIWEQGRESSPRGQKIKEINFFQGEIINPFSTYPSRKYDMTYYLHEMDWYFRGDPYDLSICKYAKQWGKIVQDDGRIFSNYGYYWYADGGLDWVVSTLRSDPDSRQAYIPMLSRDHLFEGNKDVVCTKGILFRIVDNELVMHVAMRSSDVVWGMGTDLLTFHTLHTQIADVLRVPLGKFIFSSDSIHVYERHFDMVKEIVRNDEELIRTEVLDFDWDRYYENVKR